MENFLLAAIKLYKDCLLLGSIKTAAQKYHLSVQEAKETLKKGVSFGFFKYPAERPQISGTLVEEQILRNYIKCGSIGALPKYYNVPSGKIRHIMTYYHLSIKKLCTEKGRYKIAKEYAAVVKKLTRHPTATELERTLRGKSLYNRIIFYYGSIGNIRRAYRRGPKFVGTLKPVIPYEKMRNILLSSVNKTIFPYYLQKKLSFYSRFPKKKFAKELQECPSISGFVKRHQVSGQQVEEAIKVYNISLEDIQLELNRAKTFKIYNELAKKLGRHPSTSDMNYHKSVLLYRINTLWGPVSAFREYYGIAPHKRLTKVFADSDPKHKRRLFLISRRVSA